MYCVKKNMENLEKMIRLIISQSDAANCPRQIALSIIDNTRDAIAEEKVLAEYLTFEDPALWDFVETLVHEVIDNTKADINRYFRKRSRLLKRDLTWDEINCICYEADILQ